MMIDFILDYKWYFLLQEKIFGVFFLFGADLSVVLILVSRPVIFLSFIEHVNRIASHQ
ncbi:hypothetical protein [Lentibacillus amyloliquefaciens]|uniref:hypothetical protein n=1 Tax=Lentibacillus amyloliquefaciens TaxID=1472767 RepID=UPI0012E39BA1|nr:hypothetical protein [Lentibacillus amyloliquefaciens]